MFSVVVITYNRPQDLLALLQNLVALKVSDDLLNEVIIVNNNSDVDYSVVEDFIDRCELLSINYVRSESNLGVSGGRNCAARLASSAYLLFLDDDAVIETIPCLDRLLVLLNGQVLGREVGLVSLQIRYYSTNDLQRNLFPHKHFKKYESKKEFATYYFAGAGHAIGRELFISLGGYPTDFFYGMEEYDLSYRLIQKGFSLLYTSEVVLLHKESPSGRLRTNLKHAMMSFNKSKVAWRYLPLPFFVSTSAIWLAGYFFFSRGDVGGTLSLLWRMLGIPLSNKRIVLESSGLRYLKNCEARLWY